MFVFAFVAITPINAKNVNKDVKLFNKAYISTNFYNQSNLKSLETLKEDSVKCWAFRHWLVGKLSEVSNDKELINSTADSMKDLCEIANNLGWL